MPEWLQVIGYIITFLSPILTIIGGIYLNRKHERLKNTLAKDLEIEKLKHKFQYEKEFELHSLLWRKLNNLKNKTMIYVSQNTFVRQKTDYNQTKEEQRKVFMKAYNEFREVFNNNEPFYPKDISNKIREVIDLMGLASLDFKLYSGNNYDFWPKMKNSQIEILERLDEIKELIHEKIKVT